jgi:hypothetical protein
LLDLEKHLKKKAEWMWPTYKTKEELTVMLSSLQGNSSFSSVAHSSGSRTYSKDLQCTGRLSVSLPQSELEKELGEAKLHLSKHFPCESNNLGEAVRQEE